MRTKHGTLKTRRSTLGASREERLLSALETKGGRASKALSNKSCGQNAGRLDDPSSIATTTTTTATKGTASTLRNKKLCTTTRRQSPPRLPSRPFGIKLWRIRKESIPNTRIHIPTKKAKKRHVERIELVAMTDDRNQPFVRILVSKAYRSSAKETHRQEPEIVVLPPISMDSVGERINSDSKQQGDNTLKDERDDLEERPVPCLESLGLCGDLDNMRSAMQIYHHQQESLVETNLLTDCAPSVRSSSTCSEISNGPETLPVMATMKDGEGEKPHLSMLQFWNRQASRTRFFRFKRQNVVLPVVELTSDKTTSSQPTSKQQRNLFEGPSNERKLTSSIPHTSSLRSTCTTLHDSGSDGDHGKDSEIFVADDSLLASKMSDGENGSQASGILEKIFESWSKQNSIPKSICFVPEVDTLDMEEILYDDIHRIMKVSSYPDDMYSKDTTILVNAMDEKIRKKSLTGVFSGIEKAFGFGRKDELDLRDLRLVNSEIFEEGNNGHGSA